MPCFYPITAYQTQAKQIIFHEAKNTRELTIPCRQCIGCRLEHSRQWALRMVHEASQHQENCFITLTYDPYNLPSDGSLRKKDFQLFMKRLRKQTKAKIRYYHCGEYGERNNRPHYHAIIFGYNFNDWVYLFDSPSGSPIYTSPSLESIWQKGFVTIGTVTFQSAAYIARYVTKKINGKQANNINPKTDLRHYERIDSQTGEIIPVLPEYSTMSRRPGIGHNWIARYTTDIYPKDFTTINGMRIKPPKYYDKYLESIDPEMYDNIKSGRQLDAYNSEENNHEILNQKHIVKKAQFNQLKRSI